MPSVGVRDAAEAGAEEAEPNPTAGQLAQSRRWSRYGVHGNGWQAEVRCHDHGIRCIRAWRYSSCREGAARYQFDSIDVILRICSGNGV